MKYTTIITAHDNLCSVDVFYDHYIIKKLRAILSDKHVVLHMYICTYTKYARISMYRCIITDALYHNTLHGSNRRICVRPRPIMPA